MGIIHTIPNYCYEKGKMKMDTVLQATKRETGKRSTLTQLRKGGKLAAVVYGYQTDSIPITLDYKDTARKVQKHGYTSVFQIEVEGKKINAVLSDIQRDALKGHVKHCDFLAINMAEELEVEIPVSLVGEAVGVKDGGVLMQPNLTLKIKVKPADMPDSVEVDISELTVGETLSLEKVRDKISFEVLNEDDYTLAAVTLPAPSAEEVDLDVAGLTANGIETNGEKLDSDKRGSEDK